MTLAFFPFGAFLAGLFLGSAVTVFAFMLGPFGRAASRTGGSILPGLVVGFRGWTDRRSGPRIPISPVSGERDGQAFESDAGDAGTLDGPVIVDLR